MAAHQLLSYRTLTSYGTYINAFVTYCNSNQIDFRPSNSNVPDIIVQFINHLVSTKNYAAGTYGTVHAGLLNYYKEVYKLGKVCQVDSNNKYNGGNPAGHCSILEKVRAIKTSSARSGEISKQAYPLQLNDIKQLISKLEGTNHSFLFAQLKLINAILYQGCFRIQNVLDMTFDDIKICYDKNSVAFLYVHIPWMKQSQAKKSGYNYNFKLYCQPGEEFINPIRIYKEYLEQSVIESSSILLGKSKLFFSVSFEQSGSILIDPTHAMSQNNFLDKLKSVAHQFNMHFKDRLSCHSWRRGAAYHRVFEAQNKLTLRELLRFVKWENSVTLSRYLVDLKLVREDAPEDILKPQISLNPSIDVNNYSIDQIFELLDKCFEERGHLKSQSHSNFNNSTSPEFIDKAQTNIAKGCVIKATQSTIGISTNIKLPRAD
eukprot:NODE_155_length_15238_cov_1.162560.p3 type:complete len:431 gc:universal NODE_155_length_15238_cov_1.162560:2645-1353(-)